MLHLALLFATLAAAPPLDDAHFDAYRAAIVPSGSELAFAKIPWRTGLAAARDEARVAKKPLLLWVMNGNPVGTV